MQCHVRFTLKADIRIFACNLTSERIASDKCRCRICGKTDFADRRFRKSSLSSQFGCPLSLSKISALPLKADTCVALVYVTLTR